MTRQEQDYYHNVSKQTGYLKRIAQALEEHTELMEEVVNKEKNDRLAGFKKAANLLYGNDATVNPNKGRSDENYTYPQFVDKHYDKKAFLTSAAGEEQSTSTIASFQPNIQSELDERIHKESQSITGGEFQDWFSKLTSEERESYTRVYGH